MLRILERNDWINEILKVRSLKMNEESEVVSSLCNIFNYNPIYFIYEKKGSCVISFIALTRNKTIYAPIHFLYSSLWVKEGLSDTQYCQYLDEFISALLTTYTRIEIKLPLGISDVRPFLWHNFLVRNYYTYIKNLENLDYHQVTQKNIRKARGFDYVCKQETLDNVSLKLNLQLFSDLKTYSKINIEKIKELLLAMNIDKYLTSFNCYKNGQLVASNLLFLDKKNKVAYTVLLNKTSRSNKDDVHSLLHDFFFTKLKEDGFAYVDLLGGDMSGIASFKSRFNTILSPHFSVNYNKKIVFFRRTLDNMKYLIKRVFAKLN